MAACGKHETFLKIKIMVAVCTPTNLIKKQNIISIFDKILLMFIIHNTIGGSVYMVYLSLCYGDSKNRKVI